MTTTQILWGSLAILIVFVLNQVFGRIIAQFIGGARDCEKYVGRREHTMCTEHTSEQLAAVVSRIDSWEQRNREDHESLFGRLDELKTLIISRNGRG